MMKIIKSAMKLSYKMKCSECNKVIFLHLTSMKRKVMSLIKVNLPDLLIMSLMCHLFLTSLLKSTSFRLLWLTTSWFVKGNSIWSPPTQTSTRPYQCHFLDEGSICSHLWTIPVFALNRQEENMIKEAAAILLIV